LTETLSTTSTGATQLVAMLEQLEVRVVFGLPGVHNLAVWKALRGTGIRLVGVRHEQAAVYAADGYARATGRLGVALVTTGPGAANTLGATGEAMAAGSPVLVIATDIPSALRRPGVYRGVLHETRDQGAMFAPVTKRALTIKSAEEVATAVGELAATALAPSSGPTYLGVPTDFLAASVSGSAPTIAPRPAAPSPAKPALASAAKALSTAVRPLIWAGGGALRAGSGQLVGDLAMRLAAPVITTYLGRGLLAPEHPCLVPGPVHAPPVGRLWDEADVVLAIGSDLDGMMTQNWLMPAPPKLIAINIDDADANKNYRAEITLVGDAKAVLEQLLPEVAQRDGLPELERRLGAVADGTRAAVIADDEQAAQFLGLMRTTLPPEAVVFADMCIPGYWLAGFHPVPAPRRFAYPMGWGTLGFAFPASIGAALAGAGPVVCVTGDGGFMFACGELATAVQERAPLTIVLVDDGGYGMLRFDQERAGDEPFGVDLVRPDFAALAAAFGVPAVEIDGFGTAFAHALSESMGAAGPPVIVTRAAMKPPPTTSPRWYRRS
jgi:acetolactate synthase-1/2/3 large subunit